MQRLISLLVASFVVGAFASCATTPPRPKWMMTVDSKPAGAVVYGNYAEKGGISFKPIGTTPFTVSWTKLNDDEWIKVQSGDKDVTLAPLEGKSIFVDFTVDPPAVTGATVVAH